MPTKPVVALLNRTLAKRSAAPIVQVGSPMLQELVNYGTTVYHRCLNAVEGTADEHLAILSLYLHTLEMTDGIEVLVQAGCAMAATPLVRSLWESKISIAYLLERDYTQRSLAWVAKYIQKRIASHQMLDPATVSGKLLHKRKASELPGLADANLEHVHIVIDNLQRLYARPEFGAVRAEIAAHRPSTAWYSLFGGPTSLELLAEHVGCGLEYDLFYRQWSQIAHPNDLGRFLMPTDDGEVAVRQLRHPEDLPQVIRQTANNSLQATRFLVEKLLPNEASNLGEWYSQELMSSFRAFMENREGR